MSPAVVTFLCWLGPNLAMWTGVAMALHWALTRPKVSVPTAEPLGAFTSIIWYADIPDLGGLNVTLVALSAQDSDVDRMDVERVAEKAFAIRVRVRRESKRDGYADLARGVVGNHLVAHGLKPPCWAAPYGIAP